MQDEDNGKLSQNKLQFVKASTNNYLPMSQCLCVCLFHFIHLSKHLSSCLICNLNLAFIVDTVTGYRSQHGIMGKT